MHPDVELRPQLVVALLPPQLAEGNCLHAVKAPALVQMKQDAPARQATVPREPHAVSGLGVAVWQADVAPPA
jgi:hypothetical protein